MQKDILRKLIPQACGEKQAYETFSKRKLAFFKAILFQFPTFPLYTGRSMIFKTLTAEFFYKYAVSTCKRFMLLINEVIQMRDGSTEDKRN